MHCFVVGFFLLFVFLLVFFVVVVRVQKEKLE